jgi:hypothetical protein
MGPCPIQPLQSPRPLQLPTCAFIQATIESHQLVPSAAAPAAGVALIQRSQDAVKHRGEPVSRGLRIQRLVRLGALGIPPRLRRSRKGSPRPNFPRASALAS